MAGSGAMAAQGRGGGKGSYQAVDSGDSPSGSSIGGLKSLEDALPDSLMPSYGDPSRVGSEAVAIFSLLNTILGGGILSLPLAVCKTGAAGGFLFMVMSIIISIFSLQLLCTLARKTASRTYSEIMRRAIGKNMPEVVDVIMLLLLFLVLVAFCILVKSIASDVGEYFFLTPEQEYSDKSKYKFSISILCLFVFPLMTLENLYALRYASFLGMSSILLLLGVLLYKCTSNIYADPDSLDEARMWPAQSEDVLTAAPIMLIAFLCQFNAVEVYVTLAEPSSESINRVMSRTIKVSGLIFTAFGIAGYFIAFDATKDNILMNFSPRDTSLIVARIGLVLTLICQLPMIGVPCRDLLLLNYGHLLRLCKNRRTRSASILLREEALAEASPHVFDSPLFGGDGTLHSGPLTRILSSTNLSAQDSRRSASVDAPTATATELALAAERERARASQALEGAELGERSSSSGDITRGPGAGRRAVKFRTISLTGLDPPETKTYTSRVLAAALVVVMSLLMGELVPGVSIIWTIAGSSISLLLAFILPSLAYIQLWKTANADIAFEWQKAHFWHTAWRCDRDLVYSSALLVVAVVMAVVCTYWSVHNLK